MTAAKPAKKAKPPLTPEEKKKKRNRSIILGVIAFVAILLWYGFQPLKGTIRVGICRTFAELQLLYPETFKMTMAEEFGANTRLYYTYVGAFGESRSSMIDCKYGASPTGAMILQSVQIDRLAIPAEKVALFNKTIPIVAAYKPSLVIPGRSKDTLESLKKD